MRLHTRIQAFLAATALLPLTIYGGFAAHSAMRTAETAATEATAMAAEQIAARVDEFIGSRVDMLDMLAAALAAGAGGDPAATPRLLSHALLSDESLRHLARFEADGHMTAHTLLPPSGLPRLMTDAATKARDTGATFVTPVIIGADLLPVMAVAVPIISLDRMEGVLVAEVETLELWSLARRLRLAETGYTYIVDGSGRLIAHGDPAMLARVVQPEAAPWPLLEIHDETGHAVHGRVYARHDGVDVVGAAARASATDWVVVVEKPAADAFATARRLGWILALTLVATLALVSVLAWYGARWFVGPVEHLAGVARQLGAGRFDVRVDAERTDEVGDLARGFNRLAVDLERLSGEIRRHERLSFFGRIAGGLAHDLKRPFQHLITQVRTLLDLPDDPRARALVERTLDREQAYVDRLFDDLARFSQDGALDRRPTVLPDLLTRIRDTLAPLAATAGADLVLHVGDLAPEPVLLDPLALERAVRNLVENAVDAVRDREGGRIEIRSASGVDGLRLDVLDDGPGVPEALRPHLFDAFQTTKRSGSGLGLGLAVVRRIAEEHGGRITVKNRAEGGAHFVMRLPLETAGEEEDSRLAG